MPSVPKSLGLSFATGNLHLHGCRFDALRKILQDHGLDYPCWLIGADAGKLKPFGRKERAMRKKLGSILNNRTALFAIAEPSAEGWLQADRASHH